MNLTNTHREVTKNVSSLIGPEKTALIQEEIAQLTKTVALDAKKVGDQAPDFELDDGNGTKISLDQILEKGLLILSFNRGAWCPYCQEEISALQTSMGILNDTAVNALVISPLYIKLLGWLVCGKR